MRRLISRTLIILCISILAIITAGCTLFPTGEPTPRPTYTPYPTTTPNPTSTPRPTYTPYPTLDQAPTPRPTYTPYPTFTTDQATNTETIQYVEIGETGYFERLADTAYERGREMLRKGENDAALAAFKEAQEHHGKPSAVLEGWTAISYDTLGQYDLAIQHYSRAIEIKDTASRRTNRATSYADKSECDPAITDAKTALTMEPKSNPGFHTDAQANFILAQCYLVQNNPHQALQHAEAGLVVANENQYSETDIAIFTMTRDTIQIEAESAEPRTSDYFIGPASTAFGRGSEQFNNAQYEDAIASFKEAQHHHSTPSAVLESWIGNSYGATGQFELAIQHHSNSILIDDTALDLINRAYSYFNNGECGPATTDAKVALTMEPEVDQGFHTDAEANGILALCYQEQRNLQLALQHAEAGLAIANENQYTDDDIRALAELRDGIRLEGSTP